MAPFVGLTPDHGYLMLVLGALVVECFFIAFLIVGIPRRKVFSKHYLETNFGELHRQYYRTPIGEGGYPDMGTGRYSQNLSYPDWLHFNNCQRVHYNFLEQLTVIVTLLALGGVAYPKTAAVFGLEYFIGRLSYSFYATNEGERHPFKRVGSFLNDTALLGALVLFFMSAISVIRSNNSLTLHADNTTAGINQ